MFQLTAEEAEKSNEVDVDICPMPLQFKVVFDAIRALMAPPAKSRKKIGFIVKEKQAAYGKRTKGSKRKK